MRLAPGGLCMARPPADPVPAGPHGEATPASPAISAPVQTRDRLDGPGARPRA